jgi:plastocyanin
MYRSKPIQRLSAIGAGLALLLLGAPQASLAAEPAAAPKPKVEFKVQINVGDTGFDQQEYTVGDAGGTNVDHAELVFTNTGKEVHAVKSVPGALDEGVSFGFRTDAFGRSLACYAPLPCANTHALDTGGIEPGGTVSLGAHPYDLPVDYVVTSATDCLSGNNPSFNCAPVTIHVVSKSKRSDVSGTMSGSVIRAAGSSDCTGATITPNIGPDYCFSAVRLGTKPAGSAKSPLGDTTVKITDYGFEPSLVYVKPGSTVTWVNAGERVHSVYKKGPQAPPDGYHNLSSPGMGPGESWSYTFPDSSASVNYQSNVQDDIVRNDLAGGAAGQKPSGGCGSKRYCGQPGMVGRVQVAG